ncbi:tRNA 4-thiouridine(8) synthase ThiI [Moraxella sp. K127]|uniref:tRNA uracil 4-sulfurtransferase ThiI n=1 Tax=Moraxella TaxID=475 RepID=UPI0018817D2D|nr:tRNA uracil 4-sulfurtransferase ThiI [Moraxella sp. K127]MBE9591616.1 tRNA 4-thiouridine(8) synthase ThiI [Moraxella sp. K127]
MKYIVKLHPEIMMKSDTVRKRFVKILAGNLRNVLKPLDETVAVVQHWDYIEVRHRNESARPILLDKLQCTSGIHHILEVEESPFADLHDIFEQTLPKVKDTLENKTFCVRVKRRGTHPFTSMDIAKYVGGGLNQAIASAKVQLKNPDITVKIEIEHDKMLFIKARHDGMGGFPMSTQEDVLSLISGGFDSGVASYEFIRRGSRVHYLFFNMGGRTHEIGTKQMAYELWERYSSSHKVRFTTVDFEPVVGEILTKIDDGQMGVVLKRMMMRVASQTAQKNRIEAVVTGEALGQVASQTLTNLAMIDKASDVLVLRPLITKDKADIIATAEKIGTADIAKSMPEFCGVISKSPTVKAVEHKLIATESEFDFGVLQHAIDTAMTIDIRTIKDQASDTHAIDTVSTIGKDDIVIDIRTTDETDDDPLDIPHICIPFYKLATEFDKLDKAKTYLLYCKKGVMSGLQAVYLKDKGCDNVKVLKLS